MRKPMRASDWNEKKVRFPAIAQPKIDGVRALNMEGRLTGRSLKEHGNRHVTDFFSSSYCLGFDGEMAAEHECHPALCRLTTSALSTHEGTPYVLWWLFDYVCEATEGLPYSERLSRLVERVQQVRREAPAIGERLRIMPSHVVHTLDELNEYDATCLDQGFEGTCIRDPFGMHKEGYSTVRESGLLRIKRFIEEDARVVRLVEGQTNNNPATINALGRTERSSHQENMVPNGMVGALECIDIKTGKEITVSAGSMPHEDRVKYLLEPGLIVGQTIKYKCFPKGVKDKPRFPTFQSLRAESDK